LAFLRRRRGAVVRPLLAPRHRPRDARPRRPIGGVRRGGGGRNYDPGDAGHGFM